MSAASDGRPIAERAVDEGRTLNDQGRPTSANGMHVFPVSNEAFNASPAGMARQPGLGSGHAGMPQPNGVGQLGMPRAVPVSGFPARSPMSSLMGSHSPRPYNPVGLSTANQSPSNQSPSPMSHSPMNHSPTGQMISPQSNVAPSGGFHSENGSVAGHANGMGQFLPNNSRPPYEVYMTPQTAQPMEDSMFGSFPYSMMLGYSRPQPTQSLNHSDSSASPSPHSPSFAGPGVRNDEWMHMPNGAGNGAINGASNGASNGANHGANHGASDRDGNGVGNSIGNGGARQHLQPSPVGLQSSIAGVIERDYLQIKFVLDHKRTLVSHLNAMSKALNVGMYGLKKEKQERLLTLAKRLRANGEAGKLHSMRVIVDNECPPSLRDSEGPRPAISTTVGPLPRRGQARGAGGAGTPLGSAVNANGMQDSFINSRPGGARAQNPLVSPATLGKNELSFRPSPFYSLGDMLKPPAYFIKPHLRRRLVQTISFRCSAESLQKSGTHVFLLCQEYDPQAGDIRPVYFPFYNEIELDDERIMANTRGVRGVPGSARPVDLNPILLKRPGLSHKLKITVIISDQGERMSDKSFAFGLFYGSTNAHEKMVEELNVRPHIDFNHTKGMAMKAAAADDEDGLVMSSDAVYSLRDNVMMTRISIPIRSRACGHIDCFDALTFLMLQDQAETWKCPICNKVITWESLAVDDFFSEILRSAGPNAETVAIKADGSWSLESSNDLSDSDDSDSDGDRGPTPGKKTSVAEIVDLLSDTDDEMPQHIPSGEQPSGEQPGAEQPGAEQQGAEASEHASAAPQTTSPTSEDTMERTDETQPSPHTQTDTLPHPEALGPRSLEIGSGLGIHDPLSLRAQSIALQGSYVPQSHVPQSHGPQSHGPQSHGPRSREPSETSETSASPRSPALGNGTPDTASTDAEASDRGRNNTTLPVFEALQALRSRRQQRLSSNLGGVEGPRNEIFATLRAFAASPNLIFEDPMKLTNEALATREAQLQQQQQQLQEQPLQQEPQQPPQQPAHQQPYEHEQQQPTPPVPSPPQFDSSNSFQRMQLPGLEKRNQSPFSSEPSRSRAPSLEDDIIDLTGDD